MAPRPAPLPRRLGDGPFTVRQALESGVLPGRLRRGDLATPTRGTRLRAADVGIRATIAAVALVLDADQYFSHVTAALLWDCPLPWRVNGSAAPVLHVTTVGDGPVMRRRGVVGHRVTPERTVVDGRHHPRTSSPPAFWYECRSLLTVRELVVLGDHLVGDRSLCTTGDLEARIRVGDRAVTGARAAAEQVRVGAESPMETIIRLIVVDAGFPEPALNVDVHAADGRFIGRADLAWPDRRIAIEYDGDHHRTDAHAFVRDRERSNDFTVEGWLVIHLTAPDAREPAAFLERLRQAFALRPAPCRATGDA